ncbi:VanZ family protein [Leucobacter sp. HY1910]
MLTLQRRQRVGLAGLVSVGALVALIVLWPTPVDRSLRGVIAVFLDALHHAGVPSSFGYAQLEFTANIVMFVPLGFFMYLLIPQGKTVLCAMLVPALSLTAEAAQMLFLPARYASLLDVVANSAGGWLGLLLAAAVSALIGAHRDRITAVAAQPRLQSPQHTH